jgi:hypothetical protein
MIPTGLVHSTDHGFAMLAAARRILAVACNEETEARIENGMVDLEQAIEAFGDALWDSPTEGWDVQDVLANIKDRHDAYLAAMRRLSDTLAEGIF